LNTEGKEVHLNIVENLIELNHERKEQLKRYKEDESVTALNEAKERLVNNS